MCFPDSLPVILLYSWWSLYVIPWCYEMLSPSCIEHHWYSHQAATFFCSHKRMQNVLKEYLKNPADGTLTCGIIKPKLLQWVARSAVRFYLRHSFGTVHFLLQWIFLCRWYFWLNQSLHLVWGVPPGELTRTHCWHKPIIKKLNG